jgi:hypothetical protein
VHGHFYTVKNFIRQGDYFLRTYLYIIEGEGRAGDLKIIIDRLKAIGPESPQIAPAQTEPMKKAAPVCPDHGKPTLAGPEINFGFSIERNLI